MDDVCGETGFLNDQNPTVLSYFPGVSEGDCASQCLANPDCMTIGKSETGAYFLLPYDISKEGFTPGADAGVAFYQRSCFLCASFTPSPDSPSTTTAAPVTTLAAHNLNPAQVM